MCSQSEILSGGTDDGSNANDAPITGGSRNSLLQCGELQTCHQSAGRDKKQLPQRW